MFELLADTDRLPVSEETIVQVHAGMNKVRVSVGTYVSEPSDVYIITSEDDALLRSFIVFFLAEHSIHVIYGYTGNPYDPVSREDVLQEAVDFVEEMGSILEEVPWEKMSSEERRTWIISESIYPSEDENGIEEIVDLEELEPEELQEVSEEESLEEEEVLQPEELEPEILEEEEGPEEPDEQMVEETGEGEITEEDEDGDFDNLLKKAFLKPDLVKKSRMKKTYVPEEETQEDDGTLPDETDAAAVEEIIAVDDGTVGEERDLDEVEEQDDEPVTDELAEGEEESGFEVSDEAMEAVEGDDLSALIREINDEESDTDDMAAGSIPKDPGSADDTRLTVIRYLSRF